MEFSVPNEPPSFGASASYPSANRNAMSMFLPNKDIDITPMQHYPSEITDMRMTNTNTTQNRFQQRNQLRADIYSAPTSSFQHHDPFGGSNSMQLSDGNQYTSYGFDNTVDNQRSANQTHQYQSMPNTAFYGDQNYQLSSYNPNPRHF
mmetsp:Transcript_10006/g.12360  ORF Transcript_10006/g.12360 Transcript_10006/m.12360 type:complete len:148 (+) Transcript_10006:1-444(+)